MATARRFPSIASDRVDRFAMLRPELHHLKLAAPAGHPGRLRRRWLSKLTLRLLKLYSGALNGFQECAVLVGNLLHDMYGVRVICPNGFQRSGIGPIFQLSAYG